MSNYCQSAIPLLYLTLRHYLKIFRGTNRTFSESKSDISDINLNIQNMPVIQTYGENFLKGHISNVRIKYTSPHTYKKEDRKNLSSFYLGRGGFEPPYSHENRFTVCRL